MQVKNPDGFHALNINQIFVMVDAHAAAWRRRGGGSKDAGALIL